MGTPTWMRVPQILATTVARNPFGAFLVWRTVGIFDAYRALLTILDERHPVQPVHKISRHGNSQDCMRLLELALDNLNLHASRYRTTGAQIPMVRAAEVCLVAGVR